jgi:DNA mismatch repair protein MutS
VREVGEEVLFLHLLVPGGADRSYGIEVGRLAGLPDGVLARAREILRRLEDGHVVPDPVPGTRVRRPERAEAGAQLTLFAGAEHPLLERLRGVDINGLTPLQALQLLAEVVAEARTAHG